MSEQTRMVSLIEVVMSTALGFVVSFCAWPVVAWAFDYPYSVVHNLGITGIFTVLSLVRSYVVRRFFARGMHDTAIRMARRIAAWQ